MCILSLLSEMGDVSSAVTWHRFLLPRPGAANNARVKPRESTAAPGRRTREMNRYIVRPQ